MTAIALSLVWLFAQVTAVLFVVAVLYALLGRATPRARSALLSTGLSLVVVLTLLAFSPWPNWWPRPSDEADDARSAVLSQDLSVSHAAGPRTNVVADGIDSHGKTQRVDQPLESTWAAFASGFVKSLRTPTVVDVDAPRESRPWWPTVVVTLFAAAAGLGFVRMLAGWWSIRRLRRTGRPIDDPRALERLALLRAEAGCTRPIVLRESDVVSPAATFGWRRPVVVLAANWRTWTADELQAVLAHEVAHVRRGDFLSLVWTELGVLLHFYHPLMHWLANRTRLEHELAADAAAAEVTGGPRPYLRILAEMLLRQPRRMNGRTSWTVATFLPTQRTFTRRIEMLRESRTRTLGRGTLAVAVLLLVGTGLVVAGLRGPGTTETAKTTGQDEPATAGALVEEAAADSKLDLAYLPREVVFLYYFDVEGLLAAPGMGEMKERLEAIDEESKSSLVSLGEIRAVSLTLVPQEEQGARRLTAPLQSILAVVHTKRDLTAESLSERSDFERDGELGGKPLFKSRDHRLVLADPRTIVYSNDESTLKYVLSDRDGASRSAWAAELAGLGNRHVVLLGNVAAVRKEMGNEFLEQQPATSGLAMFAPFYQNVNTAVASLSIDRDLSLEVRASCVSADGAKEVQQTASAFTTLGRNWIKQVRLADLGLVPREQRPLLDDLLASAERLVASLAVEQKEDVVEIRGAVEDVPVATIVSTLLPAVEEARTAARRTASMNNLKQLGLAMHNYHQTHGQFPPAVLTGPDGKTKYSWRVALLPYLEQQALYDAYDRNQPWDSEANKKVTEMVLPVFKDPHEPATSNHASYFALVGKGTLFDGDAGMPLRSITDGTSNSIMFVSAKRKIPWAKPEDIEVDLTAEKLPEFGGYFDGMFLAAFCDGSVHVVSENIDQDVLRSVIGIRDGQVVPDF